MSNRLAHETSPYLLQHKENPVDWHPWGEEAIAKAKAEDKPIFLSIGYSACHWCHVMEHESFENEAIAAKLNESFVSIKVDREERPDLDQIYMNAVQVMTGRGGWPMSVFLTIELKPFYGGTYWPPTSRMGMPGFGDVLDGVRDAWRNRREQVGNQAERLTEYLVNADLTGEAAELDLNLLLQAGTQLQKVYDRTHGGFGRAPKFPHPLDLAVLLRIWKRTEREAWLEMVEHSLTKMAAGGIYDQLGGGFHRYSVDERWLVPHFEKMLYDNALLSSVYVEAYQATGNEAYAETARGIYRYVLREMTDPAGGFYSTQDADSEGEEGKFFVWTPLQVVDVLGQEQGDVFNYVYDVTDSGNFEGKNIPHLQRPLASYASVLGIAEAQLKEDLETSRQQLLAAREHRVKPALDDKVLVGWNGLMIDSLARAAGPLGKREYLEAATAAGAFLWENLRDDDGRLLHMWRRGKAKLPAYLDDYAALVNAYVSLYEASFDEIWISRAVELADVVLSRFQDPQAGGFFYTADDHEQLITRNKDLADSATPSGASLATFGLLRLGKLTGERRYLEAATQALSISTTLMEESPMAAGQMLLALDFHLGPTPELVLVGNAQESPTREVVERLRRPFAPNRVLACRKSPVATGSPLDGLFEGKEQGTEEPALYVCENFACGEPVFGQQAVLERLDLK